jgi:SAM-dependent methyltransferase
MPRSDTLLPIPPDRSYESVRRHFEVERAIALRLKAAGREERKRIYSTMYDQLFTQVPDHPRLTRRADPVQTAQMNRRKLGLIAPFIRPDGKVLEFGAGDCRFAFELAKLARKVYAVDIADQIGADAVRPGNFELVVYNGYDLDLAASSIDTAFSDQLIEHLHPEDTEYHFRLVHRTLKPGGVYIFRTPHRLTGPHDVSRYFSRHAEGFHLKEWTYGELAELLSHVGFERLVAYWFGRGRLVRLPLAAFRTTEALLQRLPRCTRGPMKYLLPGISIAAYK